MNGVAQQVFGVMASASKIVLLMIAATACVGFLMGKMETKDFMILAIAVFSYYFTQQKPGAGDVAAPIAPPGTSTVKSTKVEESTIVGTAEVPAA